MEREDRDLALSRFRSDALRRTFLGLRFSATRRPAWRMAARSAQRSSRNDEHGDLDHVLGHSGAGVGLAQNAALSRLLVVHARHDPVRRDLPFRETLLRMAAKVLALRRFH